jgi:hypothetical protein
MRHIQTPETIEEQLAAIPTLPRAALVARWRVAYGRAPPKGLSRRLLEYAAAYHLQAQALGGHGPTLRRKLRSRGSSTAKGPAASRKATAPVLAPGSRLVRDWRGRTYTVEVLEGGFLCNGRRYASLSEVARSITGARWSGPRFFGL